MNAPRRCTLLFERTDQGGLRPGEWRRSVTGETVVACPACGAPDVPEDVARLWTCRQEACGAMLWLELVAAQ